MIEDTFQNLSLHENECSIEYFALADIMTETYQKLYALFRKLQKIAELESQLIESIEDLRYERISHEELFFINYGHDKSSLKDIALLCFIKDVEFDASKPQTSIEILTKAVINESIALDNSINQNSLKMTSNSISIVDRS